MYECDDTVQLDIEEFAQHMADVRRNVLFDDEIVLEEECILNQMTEELEKGLYSAAFGNAQELRELNFSKHKEGILKCYKTCADNGLPDAMIELAKLYYDRREQKPKPEAFRYYKRLSDMGYVESFRWLGDCYYYGIGCDIDYVSANKSFFEAELFGKSEDCNYCREKLQELNPELESYNGSDILKDIKKRIIFPNRMYYHCCDAAIVKYANLILKDVIPEYAPETGYSLLNRYGSGDGIDDYKLGERLLRGLGVEKNVVAALDVLETALYLVEETIDALDDPNTQDELRVYEHQNYNFHEVRDRVLELIDEAEKEIMDIDINDRWCVLFEGCYSEEEVLEKTDYWKIERIVRR